MLTSYFQTRKQTAREEQDVPHAPGVSNSRVEKGAREKGKKVGGGDKGWDAGADGCGLEEAARRLS